MAVSVCSWSGGKDSALALLVATEQGAAPTVLLTMLDESGLRSRSHGLPLGVLEAQASALGLPLVTRSTSWAGYGEAFVDGLREAAASGCSTCIFGDIDIAEHRDWCRRACAAAGLLARHPLWQRARRGLVEELLDRGFCATLIVVRVGALDSSFLGRRLDRRLLRELEDRGVDASGENGEYHTVITDGPLFTRPLVLHLSTPYAVADCLALGVELADTAEISPPARLAPPQRLGESST